MTSGAKRGFALLELLVAVAVVAALAGGAWYFDDLRGGSAGGVSPQGGVAAEQAATQAAQEANSSTAQEQAALDQLGTGASATTSGTATVSSVSVADALAGLGGDIYADGILPLGDGKYTTTAPKKGYVYLCNVASGGEGAEVNGPWIGTSTWNSNEKTAVEGNVSWPNAKVTITVANGTRTIVTNDLPTIGTTGIFPIQRTDPAYQYDGNPNSVEAQDLTFDLPASPTAAAAPQCIYGEVGVMTNGVLLLDAFDAEYRDAEAHEMQDSCQGHPHEGGMYHYHSLSSCIPDPTVTNIIGWAFDGYPITGPEISPGRYLTTADLDECHGITSPVMENGTLVDTYHYVMTEDFPYSVSCFHGKSYEPNPGAMSGMSGTSGMSGMSGMSGASAGTGGTPPAPPQAAIDACAGKASGASCTVGQTSGTCATIGGDFACKPN
ncbi:MAG TPA: YHYH protein [Candidatus Paceibacterota bacterium]|nr:YHYH protein [Candidatus Paceibacterota bacterium]